MGAVLSPMARCFRGNPYPVLVPVAVPVPGPVDVRIVRQPKPVPMALPVPIPVLIPVPVPLPAPASTRTAQPCNTVLHQPATTAVTAAPQSPAPPIPDTQVSSRPLQSVTLQQGHPATPPQSPPTSLPQPTKVPAETPTPSISQAQGATQEAPLPPGTPQTPHLGLSQQRPSSPASLPPKVQGTRQQQHAEITHDGNGGGASSGNAHLANHHPDVTGQRKGPTLPPRTPPRHGRGTSRRGDYTKALRPVEAVTAAATASGIIANAAIFAATATSMMLTRFGAHLAVLSSDATSAAGAATSSAAAAVKSSAALRRAALKVSEAAAAAKRAAEEAAAAAAAASDAAVKAATAASECNAACLKAPTLAMQAQLAATAAAATAQTAAAQATAALAQVKAMAVARNGEQAPILAVLNAVVVQAGAVPSPHSTQSALQRLVRLGACVGGAACATLLCRDVGRGGWIRWIGTLAAQRSPPRLGRQRQRQRRQERGHDVCSPTSGHYGGGQLESVALSECEAKWCKIIRPPDNW